MSSKKLVHFAGSFLLPSKFSEDGLALSPTSAALKCDVLRTNYITLTWKRLIESLDPNLTENGWSSGFVPIMMDELPAPAFSLEQSMVIP